MKLFLVVSIILHTQVVFSECKVNSPKEILSLIKENHPHIKFLKQKSLAEEKGIEQASQIPNPELDIEGTKSDTVEGDVYSTSFSLKHTFELGGKRKSRKNLAKVQSELFKLSSTDSIEDIVIKSVVSLHSLRQIHEILPLYKESLDTFNKILRRMKSRPSLSPEQKVEKEILELAKNDYELKLSLLESEQIRLNKHLSFFMGRSCKISLAQLPKSESFKNKQFKNIGLKTYSKLKVAKANLELAQMRLDYEKSMAVPNLMIGPVFEYERVNIASNTSVGIALTMDLPVFNLNGGAKAMAQSNIKAASLHLKNIESESHLDLDSWQSKYKKYDGSLRSISSREDLEKKHQRIERLFSRGIIPTSLVIESHRQLIEFTKSRFEFEIGAIEALWNIYKIRGEIHEKFL